MPRHSLFGVAIVVAAGIVGAAASQQPVFRSGVDLVTVDVTVVDGTGKPVEGLAADRFDVRVDGLRRRVVWAEYVPHQPTPPARTKRRDPAD